MYKWGGGLLPKSPPEGRIYINQSFISVSVALAAAAIFCLIFLICLRFFFPAPFAFLSDILEIGVAFKFSLTTISYIFLNQAYF